MKSLSRLHPGCWQRLCFTLTMPSSLCLPQNLAFSPSAPKCGCCTTLQRYNVTRCHAAVTWCQVTLSHTRSDENGKPQTAQGESRNSSGSRDCTRVYQGIGYIPTLTSHTTQHGVRKGCLLVCWRHFRRNKPRSARETKGEKFWTYPGTRGRFIDSK